MKTRLTIRLIALAGASTALPLGTANATDGQGAPTDFAVGGFRFGELPFALSAHRSPAGDLNGYIKVDNSVETLTGQVTCLTVVGNRAIAGGRVENESTGDAFNAFLVVEDNDGAAGEVTDRVAVISGPPATQELCDLFLPVGEPFLQPVEGNVVVHDAIPQTRDAGLGQVRGAGVRPCIQPLRDRKRPGSIAIAVLPRSREAEGRKSDCKSD